MHTYARAYILCKFIHYIINSVNMKRGVDHMKGAC